jgi:hypothetical protein
LIEVRAIAASSYAITIRESSGETRHTVTLSEFDCARLGGVRAPEAVLEAAFRFLLDREPKEAILPRFDITVIGQYFPEFEGELRTYF